MTILNEVNKFKSTINTIEMEVKKLQKAAALPKGATHDAHVEICNSQEYVRKILPKGLENKLDTSEAVKANDWEPFIGDCEYLN